MAEMKLLYERWRAYLAEEAEGENAGMTWQELAMAIEAAQAIRAGKLDKEREKQLAKTLGVAALSLVAVLAGPASTLGAMAASTVNVGGVAAGLFKTYVQQDDDKTPDNPLLKAFNLSDGFQELIDDRLEDEFIEDVTPRIERLAIERPAEIIPNMDKMIKDWLAKRKIGGTTGNTVTKSNV